MRIGRWRWIGLCLALLAGVAVAGGLGAVRKQVESSMLVKGTIDIEADGSVSAIALDRQEKLPDGIVGFVRDAALQWKFEPVLRDGAAVRARAPMSVRLVAKKLDDKQYQVEIRSASFQDEKKIGDKNDLTRIASIDMRAPRYPENAFRAGAGGTVYLLLKVGRDGHVQDAAAEQVNLRVVAPEAQMKLLRRMFSDSALAVARDWTFRPPSEGKDAADPHWIVRVPIAYALDNRPSEGDYGIWVAYVPGPRERAPWATDKDDAGFSPDALAEGGVYMANQSGPRLLTPLHGG